MQSLKDGALPSSSTKLFSYSNSSITTALRELIKLEGIRTSVRGLTAVAIGAGPAHALYFAAYEKSKDLFGGNKPNANLLLSTSELVS